MAGGNADDITLLLGNWAISNKITHAFSFNLAIPILGIYPEDTPLPIRNTFALGYPLQHYL